MTCEECSKARENPAWSRFCPTCPWCGARLIQRIGQLKDRRPAAELTARRRKVLEDWVAHGHAEQQIRGLVKGPPALAPTHGPASESESPRPAKRR